MIEDIDFEELVEHLKVVHAENHLFKTEIIKEIYSYLNSVYGYKTKRPSSELEPVFQTLKDMGVYEPSAVTFRWTLTNE